MTLIFFLSCCGSMCLLPPVTFTNSKGWAIALTCICIPYMPVGFQALDFQSAWIQQGWSGCRLLVGQGEDDEINVCIGRVGV
ncbi:hypothetical protein LZ32DRAFT_602082 [Colletotrichum eremochloae]|nr:hypothetical protein LZ32DRAFT_602082 [Colletotrichum eremochloae]